MITINQLIKIDRDLILRLRSEGKHYEADQLIKAHQESIKKNFIEGRRINRNIESNCFRIKNSKIHMQWRTEGKCVRCGGEKVDKRWLRCEKCRKLHRTWQNKYNMKKKNNPLDCTKMPVTDKFEDIHGE